MKTYVILIASAILLSCGDDDNKKQVTYDSILGVWKYSDPNGRFSTEFELYKKDVADYNIRNVTFIVDGVDQDVSEMDDMVFEQQTETFIGDIKVVSDNYSLSFYENTANDNFTILSCATLEFSTNADPEIFTDIELSR